MIDKQLAEAQEIRKLIKDLYRHGLGCGTTLGAHLGICDIAAECIERLIAKNERLNADIDD
ncbi:MAG: hypothetical protein RSC27_04880, partial [Bacilli bacterium]